VCEVRSHFQVLKKLGIAQPIVELVGLKAEKFNGKKGFQGRWLQEKGRFEVYLIEGKDIRVRPDNLKLLS